LEELELNPITNLNILPEDSEARESLLSKLKCKDNEFWAVMIPGGSKQCKLWPLERFGAVANWLGKHYSARIFLTGNVTERDIAEQIRIMAKDYVVNVAGETTIQELIEILRVSRVCITNDSGAMHIAAILKTPTVAVFNTHVPPTWWFPDNDKIIQIFSMCECSYCNMFYCDSKKCLGNITVEHVIEAVARLLLKNDQVGLSVPLNAAEMAKEI
jgi:ADP-heptose:LPS heptosyltransferase